VSVEPICVGGLNLANLRVNHKQQSGVFAAPWLSEHIPNSSEVFSLEPQERVVYEFSLLRMFTFPSPGDYVVYAIYNSIGFLERFRLDEGERASEACKALSELARLTPCQTMSEWLEFNMPQEVIDERHAERAARKFLGESPL
jgi:hypothetical protein